MKIIKTDYYKRIANLEPGQRFKMYNHEWIKTKNSFIVNIDNGEIMSCSSCGKIPIESGNYVKLGDLCVGDVFAYNNRTYLVTEQYYINLETYKEYAYFSDLDEEDEVYVYNPNHVKLSIKL